jgi:hypothetical protein
MDMQPFVDLPPFPRRPLRNPHYVNRVRAGVRWVVKENRAGIWVPVVDTHNLLTNFGMTAFAAAPSGNYIPPIYLVIETTKVQMYSSSLVGDTVVQLTGNPTIVGDSNIVLSVGQAAEETVPFNTISGTSSPFNVSLASTLAFAHAAGDFVVRAPTLSDTIASVLSEAQYDPTFNPGNRMAMASSFSPGLGQNTEQFFISGLTATNLYLAHVGLTDQQVIGSPASNLHNYAAFGYNHNNVFDLEIDVTYTVQIF